ncbi:hypothetical protein H0H92_010850 [Tricholoma furcatifolium]|nr:hypothetical protein H0H92_010850 [Tricholoma furcatifolium]
MARLPTLFTSNFGFLTLLGLLVSMVSAQSLSNLPSCAQSCATTAVAATGCSSTDAACLCKTSAFKTAVEQCAITSGNCAIEDQSTTDGILDAFCASVSNSASSSAAASSTSASGRVTPTNPLTTAASSASSSSQSTTVTKAQSTSESQNTPATSTSTSTSTSSTLSASLSLTSGGTTLVIPPVSTTVVLSTSTALPSPTTNAASVTCAREGMGAIGALAVGIWALL